MRSKSDRKKQWSNPKSGCTGASFVRDNDSTGNPNWAKWGNTLIRSWIKFFKWSLQKRAIHSIKRRLKRDLLREISNWRFPSRIFYSQIRGQVEFALHIKAAINQLEKEKIKEKDNSNLTNKTQKNTRNFAQPIRPSPVDMNQNQHIGQNTANRVVHPKFQSNRFQEDSHILKNNLHQMYGMNLEPWLLYQNHQMKLFANNVFYMQNPGNLQEMQTQSGRIIAKKSAPRYRDRLRHKSSEYHSNLDRKSSKYDRKSPDLNSYQARRNFHNRYGGYWQHSFENPHQRF